ncbi:MAG: site-2 protease family protein [Candidatus Paceibacterota bacterium]|jgi:Zn-dependent protease
MQVIDIIFKVVILIMSVVIHEISHGYAAKYCGDETAERAGRLTLNPLKHIDPIGSVAVPFIFALTTNGGIFGWARPVPYNPANLRDRKWGTVIVASAGVISNFILAIVLGLIIRFFPVTDSFKGILEMIVFINILLGFFNLIPIPPLDGSKILFSFLSYKYRKVEIFLEQYSIFVLLFFIFFLWQYFAPLIYVIFHFITGV